MYKLFDWQCLDCGFVFERIVQDGEKPACPKCYMQCKKLMSASNFNMGVGPYGYYDDNLGKYISTNRQKREEMKKQGVTPKGETPKPNGDAWV